MKYGNLGFLALIIFFKWLGQLNIKGVLFIRRVQMRLLKSVLCLVSKLSSFFLNADGLFKRKELDSVLPRAYIFFHSFPDWVRQFGIPLSKQRRGGRKARQPSAASESVPSRAAAPAVDSAPALTIPPCLSRLSLRLRSNKWQQLIKHMLSITYSRAHTVTLARSAPGLSTAFSQISPK